MRTRNRSYGESSQSSSSSNIASADRSSLKQFDQQEGKRQQRTGKRKKRTEEKSCCKFDKSCRAVEKHDRIQSRHPLQLKQTLFKVFGTRKPLFRRTNATGSSSKSRSSKASRSTGASRLSDARGLSGASRSLGHDVNDDWNEWEPRLAIALGDLYSAKLVTWTEMDLAVALFRRATTTRVMLHVFLETLRPEDQARYIRDMLKNPPV